MRIRKIIIIIVRVRLLSDNSRGGREREDVVVITVESVHMVVIGTVRVHVSVCVAN